MYKADHGHIILNISYSTYTHLHWVTTIRMLMYTDVEIKIDVTFAQALPNNILIEQSF